MYGDICICWFYCRNNPLILYGNSVVCAILDNNDSGGDNRMRNNQKFDLSEVAGFITVNAQLFMLPIFFILGMIFMLSGVRIFGYAAMTVLRLCLIVICTGVPTTWLLMLIETFKS